MSEFPRPPASEPHESHVAAHHEHHGADPAPVSLYEDSFYDSRQTALLFAGMGLGFAVLVVILLVVAA